MVASTLLSCGTCPLYGRCLPAGLTGRALGNFSARVHRAEGIPPGAWLRWPGEVGGGPYTLRSGLVESVQEPAGKSRVVTGYAGEGTVLDPGFAHGEAFSPGLRALEELRVCRLPAPETCSSGPVRSRLRWNQLRLLSRWLNGQRWLASLLRNRRSGAALVAYLMALASGELPSRGGFLAFAPWRLRLRLPRGGIAELLGMTDAELQSAVAVAGSPSPLRLASEELTVVDMGALYRLAAQYSMFPGAVRGNPGPESR